MENDLKFSGVSPVVINYTGDTDNIYAPVRGSSCDVAIVSPHILDDLYTAQKDEVCLRIGEDIPVMEMVVKFDSQGHCEGATITPTPSTDDYYSINSRTYIYSNGTYVDFPAKDFRFNGEIKDENGVIFQVNLLYDYATNKWMEDNYWNLNVGDWFLDDNDYVYRVTQENSSYYIYEWDGTGWTGRQSYQMEENGSYVDCNICTDHVVHFYNAGIIEMIFSKSAWGWDSGNKRWTSRTSYTDIDGADYFVMSGDSYHLVRNSEGVLVDTVIVNGIDDSEISDWVVELNPATRKFKRMIPLDQNDTYNIFTDDSGYLYKIVNTGELWYWSWDINQWVKWITFTGEGEFTAGTFALDYVIPGNYTYPGRKVVVKYIDANSKMRAIQLKNIQHPTVRLVEEWTGEYTHKLVWEGYKMPNTYSQDVTLNLDTIEMTAIDPVSLMKYVKIDQILTRPDILTYKQLIGKALGYVMISANKLFVERTVSYGGTYGGNNGLLDLKCQVSNFWDEMGEPATCYEMIEELLRPFCMVLVFTGDSYQIYNQNKTLGTRTFDEYQISVDGTLSYVRSVTEDKTVYDFDENDWVSNNINPATIEIGSTYDKVTGVASTQAPEYSTMAIDKVNYNDRDMYDVFDVNVQRNKSKGYYKPTRAIFPELNTKDYWYYLWNGVYVNPEYSLESNDGLVNGYLNINGAYKYKTGQAGDPSDYGSILNFYGGANNPTATGKTPPEEKPVDVKNNITAYGPDNGVPPEFLEAADLNWVLNNADYDHTNPRLTKSDTSDSKWGSQIGSRNPRVVYHQEYRNVALKDTSVQTININLTQTYSRTGINKQIDILNNNTSTNNYFYLHTQDEWNYYQPTIESANSCYFPYLWNVDNVKFNYLYFSRYATGYDFGCSEIWDRRKVYLYVTTSANSVLQFNGKEWVEAASPSDSNCFYLLKLMNGERCFHTDFKYNVIETADYDPENPSAGGHYSLTGEQFTYYTDSHGNVVDKHTSSGTDYYCPRYDSEEYSWYQYVNKVSEGSLSINLPLIDEGTATVTVDVYASNLLGTTGMNDPMVGELTRFPVPYHYQVVGNGYYIYDEDRHEVVLSQSNVGDMYGTIQTILASICFIPVSVSYFKGEHLDLDISMSVPESNLGQMFSQSDIKYTIDKQRNYLEEFQGPSFLVNTYNNLVASSFSYLIFGSEIADPGEFIIAGISGRPECFTVQAYMNWLSTIRKTYSKTLVPVDKDVRFCNIRTYITSPETGENELMVVSDSWDLKTDRHSIKAIEDQNLDVEMVQSFAVIELPRKARNERYNLPTAYKQ